MTNVPLLFLDDMGKEKMTDRMASCLFALIDQRTMHKRPTIITTNLTGDTLMERFHDKETGAAFVARLKDSDLFERVAAR
jgi:DNA replication protein DnaC